jgi:hypothetical protein
LLEFVRNKQASGFSCLEERASEAMIENGFSAKMAGGWFSEGLNIFCFPFEV